MPLQDAKYFNQFIGTHENFPKPGITFKDMMPLLNNPQAFTNLIDTFAEMVKTFNPDIIVGLESRGFLLGTPLAIKLGLPFVPIRKKGKLPGECFQVEYKLEYGSDVFELQKDSLASTSKSLKKSSEDLKILIVDDLLATGGTLNASCQLLNSAGIKNGNICMLLLIELDFLKGKDRVSGYGEVKSVLHY